MPLLLALRPRLRGGRARRREEAGGVRIAVAQRGLWREAIYRWERATQIDPTYAPRTTTSPSPTSTKATSSKARAAYEKALELEPDNALIKQNYELFKEINDRTTARRSVVSPRSAGGGLHELLRDPDRNADPAKLDVAAFQRVLVAGFIAGGTEDVDGNLETTRLLRSQLRTKSELRVIDSDVLPLMDVATEGRERRQRRRPARCRRRSRREGSRSLRARLRERRVLEEDRRGVSAAADRDRHGDVHAAAAQSDRPARAGSLRLVRPPPRGAGAHVSWSARASASTAGSSSSTAGAARRCTRKASASRSSTTRTRRRRRCRRISS